MEEVKTKGRLWWRVPLICWGVSRDYITVEVPARESKRYKNFVCACFKEDLPDEISVNVENGKAFFAEVPADMSQPSDFEIRNVEPKLYSRHQV